MSSQSLRRISIGWDGQAYTFPMSDSKDQIIGISRRFPTGHKTSLAGSTIGLFIPADLVDNEPLIICEGPTDTAAALDLSFAAIGRPNCYAKIDMTVEYCKGCSEIILIGDNDRAGRAGVEKLKEKLLLHGSRVRVIYPPEKIKDLRQWRRAGLRRQQLQKIIHRTQVTQIKISFKD